MLQYEFADRINNYSRSCRYVHFLSSNSTPTDMYIRVLSLRYSPSSARQRWHEYYQTTRADNLRNISFRQHAHHDLEPYTLPLRKDSSRSSLLEEPHLCSVCSDNTICTFLDKGRLGLLPSILGGYGPSRQDPLTRCYRHRREQWASPQQHFSMASKN
jgi:hypothetical protein